MKGGMDWIPHKKEEKKVKAGEIGNFCFEEARVKVTYLPSQPFIGERHHLESPECLEIFHHLQAWERNVKTVFTCLYSLK